MIHYVEGNIFESPAQVIVNTVNTVGVMGKGLAKTFKDYYPEMFKEYQILCKEKKLTPGKLFLYKTPNKWVLNFPTKEHWRNKSKMEYIESGLEKFVNTYSDYGITSIAFPKLGCGNGGLDWDEVKKVMEKHLQKLRIDIYIYVSNYQNNSKEYENYIEMENWLHENVQAMPYFQFKEELKERLVDICKIYEDENGDVFQFSQGEVKDSQFSDFWESMRSGNLVKEDELPYGINLIGDEIVPILKKLDYIREIGLENKKKALMLVPSITAEKEEVLDFE